MEIHNPCNILEVTDRSMHYYENSVTVRLEIVNLLCIVLQKTKLLFPEIKSLFYLLIV